MPSTLQPHAMSGRLAERTAVDAPGQPVLFWLTNPKVACQTRMTSKGASSISFSSGRHYVPTVQDAIEFCFARGWTDGLPVVPPTEALVAEFVALAGRAPDEAIGEIPERRAVITVEKAAINAVM